MIRGNTRFVPLAAPLRPAPVFRNRYRPWSESEDAALLDAIAEGGTFGDAAQRVGRNRDACLGRWRRLTREQAA